MKQKGAIFLSLIMLLIVYLAACAVVYIFFHFFKYHVIKTVLDEYRWNKVQEVPLSLFSTDVDSEKFISRANKVHYLPDIYDEDDFKDLIKETVNNQLFYLHGGESRPFGYTIWIFGKKIEKKQADFEGSACGCNKEKPFTSNQWICGDQCGARAGTYCGWWSGIPGFNDYRDDSLCFDTKVTYKTEYPVPLIFNGTDEFVGTIEYQVVEYHV